MIANVAAGTLVNLVIFVGLPLTFYWAFHKWRHKRGLVEILRRAGLQLGEVRYIGYCLLLALAIVVLMLIWPPALEPMLREGSAWRKFDGLGLGWTSVVMALLYGVVQTGFAEEFLFRGLIAGSLGRRLPLLWANLLQALIFLAPHVLVVVIMPEMWHLLIFIFLGSLFAGWARIESGSILGTWLIHASVNGFMGLSVAIRTVT